MRKNTINSAAKKRLDTLVNHQPDISSIEKYIERNGISLQMLDEGKYKFSYFCNKLDRCSEILNEVVSKEIEYGKLDPIFDPQRDELVMKISSLSAQIKDLSDSYRFIGFPHDA